MSINQQSNDASGGSPIRPGANGSSKGGGGMAGCCGHEAGKSVGQTGIAPPSQATAPAGQGGTMGGLSSPKTHY